MLAASFNQTTDRYMHVTSHFLVCFLHYLVQEDTCQSSAVRGPDEAHHVRHAPLQGAAVQPQLLWCFSPLRLRADRFGKISQNQMQPIRNSRGARLLTERSYPAGSKRRGGRLFANLWRGGPVFIVGVGGRMGLAPATGSDHLIGRRRGRLRLLLRLFRVVQQLVLQLWAWVLTQGVFLIQVFFITAALRMRKAGESVISCLSVYSGVTGHTCTLDVPHTWGEPAGVLSRELDRFFLWTKKCFLLFLLFPVLFMPPSRFVWPPGGRPIRLLFFLP